MSLTVTFHIFKTLQGLPLYLPKGSNNGINIALSPSGKAQHFDCCIQWFESTKGCFRDIYSNSYKHFIRDKKSEKMSCFAHVAQLVEHFINCHFSDKHSNTSYHREVVIGSIPIVGVLIKYSHRSLIG